MKDEESIEAIKQARAEHNSDWLDEIDFAITVRHYKEPLQEHHITDMRIRLEDKAKQAILTKIREAIGADEKTTEVPNSFVDCFDCVDKTDCVHDIRNQLRAEIRERLGL